MISFEELRGRVAQLELLDAVDKRLVYWCGPGKRIGVGRSDPGTVEVFLKGEALHSEREIVQRHLRHETWAVEGEEPFVANRLLLPGRDPFYVLAALLASELARSPDKSVHAAFEQTEPLIELALRGVTLDNNTHLGLLGELEVLTSLMASVPTELRPWALTLWKGFDRGHDFQLPTCLLEVKATTRLNSHHSVSGVDQVDPPGGDDSMPAKALFLVSLGFSKSDNPQDATLPKLVTRLLGLLDPGGPPGSLSPAQEVLLELIASYGEGDACYAHKEMKQWPAFQQAWSRTFTRIYDMSDTELAVFRDHDARRHAHVPRGSYRFRVQLPTVVSDSNPEVDLELFATRVAAR